MNASADSTRERIRDRGVAWIDALYAGFVGGLAAAAVNTAAVWLAGITGFAAAIGATAPDHFAMEQILSRLGFGALWGTAFAPIAFSIRIGRVIPAGVLYSIAPTLIQWLVVFPLKGKGLFGLALGAPTALMVLFYNAVYGLVLGILFRYVFGASPKAGSAKP